MVAHYLPQRVLTRKPSYGTVSPSTHRHVLPIDQEAATAMPVVSLDATAGPALATSTMILPKRLNWVPGWAYLVAFVLLYSANNAVLAGLMAKGCVVAVCGVCVYGYCRIVSVLFALDINPLPCS